MREEGKESGGALARPSVVCVIYPLPWMSSCLRKSWRTDGGSQWRRECGKGEDGGIVTSSTEDVGGEEGRKERAGRKE